MGVETSSITTHMVVSLRLYDYRRLNQGKPIFKNS